MVPRPMELSSRPTRAKDGSGLLPLDPAARSTRCRWIRRRSCRRSFGNRARLLPTTFQMRAPDAPNGMSRCGARRAKVSSGKRRFREMVATFESRAFESPLLTSPMPKTICTIVQPWRLLAPCAFETTGSRKVIYMTLVSFDFASRGGRHLRCMLHARLLEDRFEAMCRNS